MAKAKLKLLYLAKIFFEETDDEHSLTLPQIQERLEAHDIKADRKTLYQDFDELRQFGLDLIGQQIGHNTYYHLGARDFELPELKLLVDSVQAAKFITDKKSHDLIRKLEGLVSRHQAQLLHRQVFITGRVKAMNESIYYNIDKLHDAINSGRQIRFQYYQWNVQKEMELRHKGGWYQVSPWALSWDDEKYYLVAYDAGDDLIKHYRVDKMLNIESFDIPRRGWDHFRAFDMAKYTKSLFGMFGGEESSVILQGENSMVGILMDRFGKDIPLVPIDENHFEARVNVVVSPQFFGWIMALGSGITITGPEPVVRKMRAEACRLLEQYPEK